MRALSSALPAPGEDDWVSQNTRLEESFTIHLGRSSNLSSEGILISLYYRIGNDSQQWPSCNKSEFTELENLV